MPNRTYTSIALQSAVNAADDAASIRCNIFHGVCQCFASWLFRSWPCMPAVSRAIEIAGSAQCSRFSFSACNSVLRRTAAQRSQAPEEDTKNMQCLIDDDMIAMPMLVIMIRTDNAPTCNEPESCHPDILSAVAI